MEQTYALIRKYCRERAGWDVTVEKFQRGFDLLDSIELHGRYNIYILDIVMPELNGIELGTEIRKNDYDSKILLLTTSSEYGIESYSISASNYILKPYTEKTLFSALDKLISSMLSENSKRYLINVSDGVYAIPFGSLLYVEYYKHRLTAYTIDGKTIESIVLREPFSSLTHTLIADGRFVRVSASHIINMQYVCKVSSRYFEMETGKKVLLSRVYANARSIYFDYAFEKGINR